MGTLHWQHNATEVNQFRTITTEKYVHAQFNNKSLLNDIALLHLPEDAPLNGKFLK
jgi:hypothetical protein